MIPFDIQFSNCTLCLCSITTIYNFGL